MSIAFSHSKLKAHTRLPAFYKIPTMFDINIGHVRSRLRQICVCGHGTRHHHKQNMKKEKYREEIDLLGINAIYIRPKADVQQHRNATENTGMLFVQLVQRFLGA